jgi:hypothetical protein
MRDIPDDLLFLDHRLRSLGHARPNPASRARLRADLMLRHRQINAVKAPDHRGARRRLMLIGSPVLAVAASLVLLLSGVGFSGQQAAPAAEAARLTAELVRTVPTVTGVQLTYYRERAGMAEEYQCLPQQGQHLYIRDGHTYVYTHSRWYQLNKLSSSGRCPQNWQLAFANLPARLAAHRFEILPAHPVDGIRAIGIRYRVAPQQGVQIIVTAWVDRGTGLIMRLVRVQVRAGSVVARDVADYQYQRTP